jgi:ABC-type cobalamin/Fe3+-siderophores transport system ATPase subunit
VQSTISLSVNPETSLTSATVQPAMMPQPPTHFMPPHAHGTGVSLPTPIAVTQLTLHIGQTLIVTGPNGVGKSGLLADIARGLTQNQVQVETFFGNRHIQFGSDDIDQIGQSLDQLKAQLQHSVTRFRHPYGEQHLKSVVRRIANRQAQATHDMAEAQEAGASYEAAKLSHPQVLPTINAIFEAARLPVRIALVAGTLRARRGEAEYGIDRLSDGERAALLLVGATLIQPANSFILVDEPERHLNPAISGPLLAALIRTRPDLGFVFASHDLELIEWLRPEQMIHLRDSLVTRPDPEERRYDLTLVRGEDGVPEELRFAVLGSRRLLLLVEGETSSEDKALYAHVYPGWNVVAKGGCDTVINGVRALANNGNYHWLHSAGLIDRDGRGEEERSALAADRIFSLPVPTIENLFLHPDLLKQMAAQIHELKGGADGTQRIEQLKAELPSLLRHSKNEIILKRLVWEANRRNSEQKVSARSIQDGQAEIPRIDLQEIKRRLETAYDSATSSDVSLDVLLHLPVKNSRLPTQIAKLLGYDNAKDYMRAVLRQIEIGSPAGKTMLETLRAIMPQMPTAI